MNVTCDEAELWISVRIDGERLADAEARDLEAHLSVCTRCRRILETEMARSASLRRALAAGGDPSADARLRDAVLAGLETHWTEAAKGPAAEGRFTAIVRSSSFRRGARRWALRAAAVLVASLAVWSVALFSGRAPRPDPAVDLGEWRIIVEDTRWDARPSFSRDGNHWLRDVERQRRIILDPLPLGPAARPREGHDILLDREKVETNYIRFTGWSYH